MPNYDYANSTGLTALSERTFEKIKKEITTDIITSEAANPLVIETDAAQYAKNTHLTLEPVQDLHGYDHPWPAGGGKNKFICYDTTLTAAGLTFEMKGHSVKITGTASADTSLNLNFGSGNNVGAVLKNGSAYTWSAKTEGTISDNLGIYGGYLGSSVAQTSEFKSDGYASKTIPSEGTYQDRVWIAIHAGEVYNGTLYIQTEEGSEKTPYAPYSNICPISGLDEVTVERTGKNLLLNKMARTVLSNGITYSLKDDGTVVLNGTASSTSLCDFLLSSDKYIIPKGDYILSDDYSKAGSWGTFLSLYKDGVRIAPDLATTYGSGVTSKAFSTSSYDYDAIAVGIYIASGVSLNNAVFKPMIRLASDTDDTYEPYQKFSAEVPLPTTIYGGTLNLETGELVVDWKKIKINDLSIPVRGTATYFYSSTTMDKAYGATKVKCSCYKTVDVPAGDMPECSIKGNGANPYLYITDTRFSTGAELKNALGDQDITYELATPVTYHLTPAQLDLLKGTNVITVNGKTIQVTYREGALATLEEVNEVSNALVSEECTSEESNPVTVETDAAQYAKNTHLTLAPVQDLHGYDHPWPAGGGKNLLKPTQRTATASGVTYSVDENGKITLTGTASANNSFTVYTGQSVKEADAYTCSLNGNTNAKLNNGYNYATLNIGSDLSPNNFLIQITSGVTYNESFDAMLEKGSTATSYEPYSNICPITPMGHRNLLQITEKSLTHNGVVFTINDDGTIIANGTASSPVTLPIGIADGGNCIVTGCDAGGESTYGLRIGTGINNTYHGRQYNGSDYYINTQESITVSIYVYSGQVLNNVIFKPMIRLASDPDSTFVPYGMARVGAKVTGFNIWDEKWEVGTIDSSTGQPASASNTIRAKNYIRVNPNTMYYFKSSYNGVIDYYGGNKEFIRQDGLGANEIITTPNNCHYIKIRMASTYGTTYNHDICINISDAEKNGTYEPYTESVSSVDLPEEVYSGTLDLETGEVVVDMGMVDLGTLTWGYASGENRFYALLSSIKSYGYSEIPNIICSQYKTNAWDVSVNGDVFSASGYISVKDNSYNDAATFKTAMSGVQLCYELATPVTYQLTPQQLALFKGINNISTNAKTVQVTYRNGELATTGNIVDAVEVAKQNAIGESESYTDDRLATELAPILGDLATAETSPAIASHAVGEYLLYNKHLYKVLAAISAGQQLTIGTNIGKTNVAAELASLNNVAIHFITDVNEGSGTQSNLIDVITNVMTVNGFYQITGTYTNHAYGYTATGWRVSYANEPRYAGVVICHDGNVMAFSKQGTSTAVIKVLATP